MDSETLFRKSELTQEGHVMDEKVPNSQKTEHEYIPLVSQSQHVSKPGPSNQSSQLELSDQAIVPEYNPIVSQDLSKPGPYNQSSQLELSDQALVPECNPIVSQDLSKPGPSNQSSQVELSDQALVPEYNPIVSQDLSKPGPSNQESQAVPYSQDSEPGSSNQASLSQYIKIVSQFKHLLNSGPSDPASEPGPSHKTPSSVREFTGELTSGQKRRGRPSRNSTAHLKPTRGSQRIKKCPKVLSYDSFKDLSWKWSEKDKKSFLAGILEVGVHDIKGIKRFLPHKTEDEIKRQIALWKGLAARSVEKSLAEDKDICGVEAETIKNLNEWIEEFKKKAKASKVSPLVMSTYFEIVSEYGDFPSPEQCGGVDFRAMYRYLHCMVNGIPHHGLNKATVTELLSCLDDMMEKLENPNLIETLEEHLYDPPSRPDNKKFGKTYSRKGNNVPVKPIDHILNNPVMNPLNLPESAVMKVLSDDSDGD